MIHDYIYDLEVYPNVFTMAVEHVDAPLRWAFEISDWRNDSAEIIEFCRNVASIGGRLVGFNNLGFDYPILHALLRMGHADAQTLYAKAQAIIGSQNSEDDDERWLHQVKPTDRIVPQVDLYKIHHFDNKARATGLKVLEFNMRSDNISDLPFPVGTKLAWNDVPVLKQYNAHDVSETKRFYHHTKDMIRFREQLCAKYPGRDWLNANDTKIGKEYFTMRLEGAGVQCYEYGPEGRRPRQTVRQSIALRDAILPWIKFDTPEFQRVLDWLKEQTITETKGVFSDVVARVGGLEFVFGLGGIHASVENEIVSSDDGDIVDIDVESYYPSTAIAQRFRPAHFPESFCDIYADLKEQRKQHKKGTAENAMLKLALNGVYGDSNNRFSVFYDPLMTMQITLNGQLLLCLLVENLLKIPGLRVTQGNTDGITVQLCQGGREQMTQVVQWWEGITKLKMEFADYKVMCIRDVNNYLAQYTNGKVKRKGAYEYDLDWHQNHGALVIPKVAEKVLLEGAAIRETVEQWSDRMDFMLRAKVPRSSYLQWGEGRVQNTTRYYIAQGGKPLFKWMPPLKGKNEWRRIGVESGWTVQVCNDIADAVLPVDVDYYVNEIEKLTNGLR
ncbi:hypothetical protein UFOVP669_37 [uncultured Caudovirales phage]|uniref:Uncharacterized protein n=1 Tax=uncultured Caudovirales phage TaxID=2100421 RepID=A0A6J5NGE2_9CAUD|nr:hypothetical protein UFOVP400_28 [uncultured Caudovirales phage]CAB4155978.1 hypothetical protein UFOVP669_37 [uncultured Caudovirales phage]CAB4213495.1 hypothetical protein UFOVP1449_34 [uncultured Caudovirales phage]